VLPLRYPEAAWCEEWEAGGIFTYFAIRHACPLLSVPFAFDNLSYQQINAPATAAPSIMNVGSTFAKTSAVKLPAAIRPVGTSSMDALPRVIATAARRPITAGRIPLKHDWTIFKLLNLKY